jgi:hypothetical protein
MMSSNMTENVTNDIISDLYDVPVYVASCVIITLAVEVIGNGLLAIIIMYEKYGMDPQKRTAINQVLSKVCWLTIMTNLIVFPFMVMRTLFGLQSELVALWCFFGVHFSLLHNILTLTEMMILKCLYMFFWPRMAMLDDNLAAQFIGRWNLMISSICVFSRLYLVEYHANPNFQFATGHKFFNKVSDLSQKAYFM